MTATATEAPACPKCGGKMWDNTITKRNPKAPDFKCRDRACDGVVWPDKGGKANGHAAPAAARTPQPVSLGNVPWEETETGAPPAHHAAPLGLAGDLVDLYKRCMNTAQAVAVQNGIDKLGGDVAGAVTAMGHTLFIAVRGR